MGESDAGNLGDVTWGARIRLQELESDIAAAQSRLDDFYKRNDGRAVGVGFGGGGTGGGAPPTAGGWANVGSGISPNTQGQQLTGAPGAALGGPIYNYGSHYGPVLPTGAYTMGGSNSQMPVNDYIVNYGSNYGPQTDRGTFRSGGFDISANRSEGDIAFKQFLAQEKSELRGRNEVDSWRQQASDRYVSRFMSESQAANTLGPEDLAPDEEETGGARGGGRSSIFSLRGLTRRVGAGILIYEGLRIAQQYQESEETLRLSGGYSGTEISVYQQESKAIEGIPLLGQAATIASKSIARHFGVDSDRAIYEADQSQYLTSAGSARLSVQQQIALQSNAAINSASVIGVYGEYSQRIASAQGQAQNDRLSAYAELTTMQNQYNDLTSGPMTPESAGQAEILGATYLEKYKRLPNRIDSANLIEHANIDSTNRNLQMSLDDMIVSGHALSSAIGGRFGESSQQMIEARRSNELSAADPLARPGLAAYQNLQRQTDAARNIQDMKELEAGTTSLQLQLSHQPLAASLNTIEGQRQSAIANAGFRPVNMAGENDSLSNANQLYNTRLKSDINSQFDVTQDLATQAFREKGGDLSYGIAAERSSIAALNQMNPDTTLSQAIGIRATTYQRVTDLARAGFIDQAHAASAAGQEDIELAEGEFIRGFHGVQVDPRHININAPRGSVNIAKRLKEMEDQKKLLTDQNSTFELKMHVGAFAKDAPKAGSGGGSSVTEMTADQLGQIIQSALKSALAN